MTEMLWLSLIVPIIKHDNWNVRGREGVCWPVRSTQSTIDTIRVTMAPVECYPSQRDDRCRPAKVIRIKA